MTDPDTGWQAVARLADLPENGLADVLLGRQLVLLARRGEEVLAFQGLCPHQFARLSEGRLTGDWLRCPRHFARFGLADGACGPGWTLPALQRFATRLEAGMVLLPDPLVALD
jgi:3-phenylpropionate/trans-cinnamate dioxygenase ferredoxin subunit